MFLVSLLMFILFIVKQQGQWVADTRETTVTVGQRNFFIVSPSFGSNGISQDLVASCIGEVWVRRLWGADGVQVYETR